MKTRHALTALGAPILVGVLAGLVWAAAPLLAQPGTGPGHGPRTWENFAERHDVDGDGQVTREELAATLDLFDRVDDNGDGVLTEGDFEAHHGRMAFGFLARRADADRNGETTAAELDTWFAARDTNGDGRLGVEDVADRRPGARRPHHGFAEALDADGDGLVTAADLDALLVRYDADGDGALAGDELPEAPRHHGRFHHRGHGRGMGPGPGSGR